MTRHRTTVITNVLANATATIILKLKRHFIKFMTHVVGVFQSESPLTRKEVLILNSLLPFYTDETLRTVMLPVVDRKVATGRVSLRCVEWLVVNHAKTSPILIKHGPGRATSVYTEYKVWLSRYRRALFDPFRRRRRVWFTIDGVRYDTTVGQLNFIYWAHQYGVLTYARTHQQEIEDNHAIAIENKKNKGDPRRRRFSDDRQRCVSIYRNDLCLTYPGPTKPSSGLH